MINNNIQHELHHREAVRELLSRPEVIHDVEELGRELLEEMNLKDDVEQVAEEVGHHHFY